MEKHILGIHKPPELGGAGYTHVICMEDEVCIAATWQAIWSSLEVVGRESNVSSSSHELPQTMCFVFGTA